MRSVPTPPALNIDEHNRATIVHRAAGDRTGYATQEGVRLYNTIPGCGDNLQDGSTGTPRLPQSRAASRDWYENPRSGRRPRPIAGLSRDQQTLYLFIVDAGDGHHAGGLTVYEAADLLLHRYGVQSHPA